MNFHILDPFLKQAMLTPNANIQRPAANIFQNMQGSEDPDAETIDEHIVEDPEKQKDQKGENTEGDIMEPAFQELEEETEMDRMKEEAKQTGDKAKVLDDIETSSLSKTSCENYWEFLKTKYANNSR